VAYRERMMGRYTSIFGLLLALRVLMPLSAAAQMPSLLSSDALPQAVPAISVFTDWRVACLRDTGQDMRCRAEPARIISATGPAPSLTIVREENAEVLILRTPLGLLLSPGVALSVDGNLLGRLSFQICEADGCSVPVRLTGQLRSALQRGRELDITMIQRDGTPWRSTLSLMGFTAALGALAQ